MYNNKKTLQNKSSNTFLYNSNSNSSPAYKFINANNTNSSLQMNSSPSKIASLQKFNNNSFDKFISPHDLDDILEDETLYFERNRIQHLKDERIYIQKKTFTKWCNSYLNKVKLKYIF